MKIEVEEDCGDFRIKLHIDDEHGRVRAIDVVGRNHFELRMRPQKSGRGGDDRWTLEAFDPARIASVMFRDWKAFSSDGRRLREEGGLLGRACAAILQHVGIDERPTLGRQSGLTARIEAVDRLVRQFEVEYGGKALVDLLRPAVRRQGFALRPDLDAIQFNGDCVGLREAIAVCTAAGARGKMPAAEPLALTDLQLVARASWDSDQM